MRPVSCTGRCRRGGGSASCPPQRRPCGLGTSLRADKRSPTTTSSASSDVRAVSGRRCEQTSGSAAGSSSARGDVRGLVAASRRAGQGAAVRSAVGGSRPGRRTRPAASRTSAGREGTVARVFLQAEACVDRRGPGNRRSRRSTTSGDDVRRTRSIAERRSPGGRPRGCAGRADAADTEVDVPGVDVPETVSPGTFEEGGEGEGGGRLTGTPRGQTFLAVVLGPVACPRATENVPPGHRQRTSPRSTGCPDAVRRRAGDRSRGASEPEPGAGDHVRGDQEQQDGEGARERRAAGPVGQPLAAR